MMAALLCLLTATTASSMENATPKQIVVIAHRGAHEHLPENTVQAVRGAVAFGVDYVEIDIRQTSDGKFVNFHDGTVDRKTNGTGAVRDHTLAELLALDAGSYRGPEHTGARIATADESFGILDSAGVGAYVDVKDAPADSVVALLRRHGLVERSAIYGNPDLLAEIMSIEPSAVLMPELPRDPTKLPELADRLRPAVIAISNFDRITEENVAACHAVGAVVWVDIMARDTPEGWAHAVMCGIDGIQTDRPDALIAWLRKHELRR